jgi:hypothetical protein
MFSPSMNGPPSASERSSRRRQRPLSNEGSILQPKAKRQRSTLNEQTFVAPDTAPEMEEIKGSKIAALSRRDSSREIQASRREIAVRGKKLGDRSSKGDGSVVLVRLYMIYTLQLWHLLRTVEFRPRTIRIQLASFQHSQIAFVRISQVCYLSLFGG